MSKIITVLSKIPNLKNELGRILPNLKFVQIDNGSARDEDLLLSSEIIVADADLFVPYLYQTKSVKWVQMTWAGLDVIYKHESYKGGDLPYLVTRFSGEHFGRIMSEYVIASIVNHERSMFQVKLNQTKHCWNKSGSIQNYRIISDLTFGILGLGQISSLVAQNLNLLGGNLICLGRSNRNSFPSFINKYYTTENLNEFLSNCDYVINVLPSTKETIGLLNNDVLKHCAKRSAVFINIGRGSIIAENDLINALNNKWISGAILDVFELEPLPKESPLWDMPQVLITPHVSGTSRAKDIAEQFAKNYELYCSESKIPTTVDFSTGY
ncbi:glyoxylate/hydroxypyruvate reductase A-like [Chrysoperla carnea]|uniref:glyoxylate/hydroxypyruvate reductase A-like n=1 Tax=Chrysoperla carnea TaxID=189513 RepID=UPI001D077785|nr:glyoxylate/hydroxypyruvate reductase A-like [Chrysoperla carnea]